MADSTIPLISGRTYDWSMIEIYFGFTPSSEAIYGIRAVRWERKRKVESNYGIGSQPISRGYGNRTHTAPIELDYATQVMFQEVSPDGTLMGPGESDLIVHFVHPDDGRTVTTPYRNVSSPKMEWKRNKMIPIFPGSSILAREESIH